MTKLLMLAGALAALTLADCGGGSSSASPIPSVAATAAVFKVQPQAIGSPTQSNGSPLPYVAVTSPAGGPTGKGETVTLASAVPVYNIGTAFTVAFSFTAAAGVPVAVQVGTTSSFTDYVNGTSVSWASVNGKTSIPCFFDDYNFNEGAIPNGPIDPGGTTYFDYLACAGNPFS